MSCVFARTSTWLQWMEPAGRHGSLPTEQSARTKMFVGCNPRERETAARYAEFCRRFLAP